MTSILQLEFAGSVLGAFLLCVGNKCIITDESDDHSTKGAITGASCLAVWTSDDSAACEVDQYGCPDSACDATSDDDRPWCMYDEDNWCYCE